MKIGFESASTKWSLDLMLDVKLDVKFEKFEFRSDIFSKHVLKSKKNEPRIWCEALSSDTKNHVPLKT